MGSRLNSMITTNWIKSIILIINIEFYSSLGFQTFYNNHGCGHQITDPYFLKRLNAVTDPLILLESDIEKDFEEDSHSRNSYGIKSTLRIREKHVSSSIEGLEEHIHIKTPRTPTVFHHEVRSKRNEKKKIMKQCPQKLKSVSSRASTMPGYKSLTKEARADKRTLEYIESQTGRDLSKAYRRKRQKGGQKMYLNSVSVPDSLVQFANELHQEDRITPLEERDLGRRTQEAIRLQNIYDELETTLHREPSDEEWCAAAGKINMEALRSALSDGIEAKNKLITSNLRMVQRVVNVYIKNGLTGQYNAGDMMQDGIMGLIRAVEKFEPDRGFRFSTYAMYWIRSSVKHTHTFQSRVITIPQRMHANQKRVVKSRNELQEGLGRSPTLDEIANKADMSSSQLMNCIKAMDQKIYSLDQAVQNTKKSSDNNKENTLIEFLESKKDDADLDQASQLFLRQDLLETLYRVLDKQAAHMLVLRFGLVDSKILPDGYEGPLTIREVSEIVGMKPDKVRRKLISSLQQLKSSIGHEWRDYERIMK